MKPSPSPAATEEAIAEASRWLNDIEHLLTQERRSFEMETAWDHDWARTMREEQVHPIFNALLSLIAASRGTRALTEEEKAKLVPLARVADWGGLRDHNSDQLPVEVIVTYPQGKQSSFLKAANLRAFSELFDRLTGECRQ